MAATRDCFRAEPGALLPSTPTVDPGRSYRDIAINESRSRELESRSIPVFDVCQEIGWAVGLRTVDKA